MELEATADQEVVYCEASMTGATTFNEITLNEIEGRSHAVMAGASQAIVRVAQQSRIAKVAQREVLYGKIFLSVRSISGLMHDLLEIFHAPDVTRTLESATPEQLNHIVEMMYDTHGKVEHTLAIVHPTRYWRSLYRPYLETMRAYNNELASHARTFSSSDSALILLTKRDQDHLTDSLSNPPEPNAALRRAFARK